MHLGGASTEKNPNASYAFLLQSHVDGMRYFFNKHYPKQAALVDFFLKLGFGMRGLFYNFTKDTMKAYAYNNLVFKQTDKKSPDKRKEESVYDKQLLPQI
jgi:hypothetical protein